MIRDNLQFNEMIKPNSAFLEDLSRKLPEFFTAEKYDEEGNIVVKSQFDLEKFQKTLKEQNVEELSSGYQLDFIGKNYAKKQAGELPTTVIVPDNEHNEKSENKKSNNLFLTGDNLEVLRHLQQNYSKSIDFIYIDPPYNTGTDGFVYPDNFEYSDGQLKEMFGLNEDELKRLKSIQGKSTHSAWLTFMYPRLYLAKKLLKDTGIIFISIDDNEQANLKLLMDNVYGEAGFLGEIIWQSATDNNASQISIQHEYVIGYAKNFSTQNKWIAPSNKAKLIQSKYEELASDMKSLDEIQKELGQWIKKNQTDLTGVSHYKYVDDKGVYYPGNSSNTVDGDYQYDIIHPVTKKPTKKPAKGWRWPATTFWKADKIGDVEWGKDETTIPKIKKRIETATDLLKSVYYDDNRVWTKYVSDLIGGSYFNNPKSMNLMKTILKFVTNKDSLVLDFFAGSSTTADAVMQLNAEDDGNRQFIMCTLPEPTFSVDSDGKEIPTKGGKAAYMAGYKSIDEISRERIIRAATKIKAENPLLTETLDFGFKHYRVVPARQDTLDKLEFDDNLQLDMFDDMISSFSSEKLLVGGNATGFDTILQTYLVKDNYKFDVPVKMIDFKGIQVPYVNNQRVYIITENWTSDNTKALVNAIGTNEISVQTIVVYGYTMDMERLRELEIALSQLENKVNWLVRY